VGRLRFNGTAQYFQAGFTSNLSQPSTYYIVLNEEAGKDFFMLADTSYFLLSDGTRLLLADTPTANTGHFFDSDTAGGTARNLIGSSTTHYQIYSGTSQASTAARTQGSIVVLEALFSGASSFLTVNGTSVVSANSGTNAENTHGLIGVGNGLSGFFAGDMFEVIIYNADIGSGARQQVRQYLYAKYGVTGT
jgi:hypothetical protein